MKPQDLIHLQDVIERTQNPLVKRMAEECLMEGIRGIKQDSQIRRTMPLTVRIVIGIVAGVALMIVVAMTAAGQFTLSPAYIGTIIGAAALYVVRGIAKNWLKDNSFKADE